MVWERTSQPFRELDADPPQLSRETTASFSSESSSPFAEKPSSSVVRSPRPQVRGIIIISLLSRILSRSKPPLRSLWHPVTLNTRYDQVYKHREPPPYLPLPPPATFHVSLLFPFPLSSFVSFYAAILPVYSLSLFLCLSLIDIIHRGGALLRGIRGLYGFAQLVDHSRPGYVNTPRARVRVRAH